MDNPLRQYDAWIAQPSPRAQPEPAFDVSPLWYADIEPVLDARDFVQGVLIEQSSVVVYGASNSGKTFWTTDLALHVACGLPWNSRRVEQGGVVYLALEGGNGFRNRVAAWKVAKDPGRRKRPFAALPGPVNLLGSDDIISDLVARIDACAQKMDVPLKLIIVDTMSRAIAGGNENASEVVGLLILNIDRIRRETGAAVLLIHHSGKDVEKGARGHSSLQASVDTEIEVVADPNGVDHTVRVVKQRDLGKGQTFPFTLKVVEIGENRHGETVTTCLVEHAPAGASAVPPSREETGRNKQALELLESLILSNGRIGDDGVPSGCLSIPEKWWRDQFYERVMPDATPDTRKHAFLRIVKALADRNVVGRRGIRVWLAPTPPLDRDVQPGQSGHGDE